MIPVGGSGARRVFSPQAVKPYRPSQDRTVWETEEGTGKDNSRLRFYNAIFLILWPAFLTPYAMVLYICVDHASTHRLKKETYLTYKPPAIHWNLGSGLRKTSRDRAKPPKRHDRVYCRVSGKIGTSLPESRYGPGHRLKKLRVFKNQVPKGRDATWSWTKDRTKSYSLA